MRYDDNYFMNIAIKEAKKALLKDEVPIGAVIVKDNKIISKGFNLRETKKDVTCHAEIVAIRKASKKLNDWQLIGTKIYVTLEPCLMCASAIIQSRISEVIFGAYDSKGGSFKNNQAMLYSKTLNHYPLVKEGIKEGECSEIIKNYFKNKRNSSK